MFKRIPMMAIPIQIRVDRMKVMAGTLITAVIILTLNTLLRFVRQPARQELHIPKKLWVLLEFTKAIKTAQQPECYSIQRCPFHVSNVH